MPDGPAPFFDPQTIAFYEKEAESYAVRARKAPAKRLALFLGRLKPGARILELGCGGGQDAETMLQAGFDVLPTDGTAGLACMAERRLGRPVAVMRFEELEAREEFDGIWASACLLHVPADALSAILSRVYEALRKGGIFYASFKSGTGGERDSLGRYYNFPSRSRLESACVAAAPWAEVVIEESEGGGYDGVARIWLHVLARKDG